MGVILNKLNTENSAPTNAPTGGGIASRAAANPAQVTPQTVIQKLASKYSAVSNTLGNYSEGLVKTGIKDLIVGPGELASKALSYLPGKAGKFFRGGVDEAKIQQETNLKNEGTAQKLGGLTADVATFFIPSAKINVVEKILAGGAKTATLARLTPLLGAKTAKAISNAASLGTKMAVRATEAGGVVSIQSGGNPDEIKTAAEVGGIIPAAGAVLKPLTKIASPFSKSYKPGVDALFHSEGITPPLSAISDSNVVRGAEAVASKGIFGGQVADIANKASAQLEQRTANIISKIKPGKVISDEGIGKELQKGLEDFNNNRKLVQGKIYDEFSKTYGKSNVYGMKTKDALATILEEQKQSILPPDSIDSKLQFALDKLTGAKNPQLKDLQDQINKFKSLPGGKVPPELTRAYVAKSAELDKNLTFAELKKTRTDVGELMTKNPENTALKRLYGALTDDMTTAVNQVASQDPLIKNAATFAKDSLDKLNQGYATGMNKLQSDIAQSIEKSHPESIAKNFIKRNSADSVKLMKEIVGPEKFKNVTDYFMRDMFDTSLTRGEFNVSKLKNNLASYDKETLNELLNPAQQKELNDAISQLEKYQTMGEALKSGQAMAKGSQTAFLSKIGILSTAIFSGHFAVASGILLGDVALKKLFTTEFGRKLLTEGLTVTNLKTLNALKGVSELTKKTIIESFRTKSGKTQQ